MKSLFTHLKRTCLKKLTNILIVCTLCVSVLATTPIQDADAFLGGDIVFDPSNFVKTTLTAAQSAITAAASEALNLKEFTLDPLVNSIAKKMLQQSTAGILDWFNTGFDGNPAFITDYLEYFQEAEDESTGEFLDTELDNLCEYFKPDIKGVLTQQVIQDRDFQTKSECSITGSESDTEQFVSGDFSKGGLRMWFDITTDPRNNFFGSLELNQQEIAKRETEARDAANTEAIAGNGVKSEKLCYTDTGRKKVCKITKPGNVISEMINFKLTVGDRVLIEADEVSEMISGLFSNLSEQAITGVNGLLGLSFGDGNGSASYLDDLRSDAINGTSVGNSVFITTAIGAESRYSELHESVLVAAEAIASDASVASCSEASDIEDDADTIATAMSLEIETAQVIKDTLSIMQVEFDFGTDAAKLNVLSAFEQLKASGDLHSEADIALREIDLRKVSDTLDDLEQDLATCN